MKFKRHSDFFADQDCTGELVPVESADRLLTLPKGSQVFWCWCLELSFGISPWSKRMDGHSIPGAWTSSERAALPDVEVGLG